ncbi:ABC transporter substrate-binding protein [Desulfosoma caldarium]|uniref:ABC-type branched-subunit amino acid transport system substrate-binding protein n=1 Tax=Desulfosoma caldarium TaxID=610254 RepID=A0A3N1UZN8_9BACT|nr:ABC transporter substrate-binding protein [Desulfosoma caldarium]ROQ93321.1 ABC-type branched-subunit amino acid transport system substrate-binding protein [Desulfosoma caldarium]
MSAKHASHFLACIFVFSALVSSCAPRQQVPVHIPEAVFHEPPPAEAQVLWKEAVALRDAGRLDAALATFQRIAAFFPSNAIAPAAITAQGDIWLQAQNPKAARQAYEAALKEYPQWRDAATARIGLLRARWYDGENRKKLLEEAEALWEATASHPSWRQQLIRLLVGLHREAGQVDRALFWLDKGYAAQLGPEDQRLLDQEASALVLTLEGPAVERALQTYTAERLVPFLLYRRLQLGPAQGRRDGLLKLMAQYPQHPIARRIEEELRGVMGPLPQADPHKLGCMVPLSGPHSAHGRRLVKGVALALRHWEKLFHGTSARLVLADTQANPDVAVSALNHLVQEERVLAVLGPLNPKSAKAILSTVNEKGIPVVSFTEKRHVTSQTPFLLHAFMDHQDMIGALLTYCRNAMGFRNFGVLYPEEPYGRALRDIFVRKVLELDGRVVVESTYAAGMTDFKGPIQVIAQHVAKGFGVDISETPLDALFIPDAADTIALIAPQLPYYNVVGVTLLGTNLWEEKILLSAGGVYLEGALFPSAFQRGTFEAQDPVQEAFARDYGETYGEEPDFLAAQGYTATLMALHAREHVLKEGRPDRLSFRQWLLRVELPNGPLGPVRFAPDGHMERQYPILQVQGGAVVRVD